MIVTLHIYLMVRCDAPRLSGEGISEVQLQLPIVVSESDPQNFLIKNTKRNP